MLQPTSITVIPVSKIRALSDETDRALDIYSEHNPDDLSWGSNDKTLVNRQGFLAGLRHSLENEESFPSRDSEDDEQISETIFLEDIMEEIENALPESLDYIDLEN